jgi:hypothetical protein
MADVDMLLGLLDRLVDTDNSVVVGHRHGSRCRSRRWARCLRGDAGGAEPQRDPDRGPPRGLRELRRPPAYRAVVRSWSTGA